MNAVTVKDARVFLSGREILHNINWQVERGERCFILGANGAGKTTLVRMLMGYAWPVFGATVEVLGKRFGTVNLQELRKRIAWVSPLMHQWLGDREWTGREMVLSGPQSARLGAGGTGAGSAVFLGYGHPDPSGLRKYRFQNRRHDDPVQYPGYDHGS